MGDPEAFQKAMNLGHDSAWDQDWEHAAQYYRQALDLMPDNVQALTSLALALFEMQDFEGALSAYQQASFRSPEDPIPVEKMARIYERMGRLAEAIKASLQAADLDIAADDPAGNLLADLLADLVFKGGASRNGECECCHQ